MKRQRNASETPDRPARAAAENSTGSHLPTLGPIPQAAGLDTLARGLMLAVGCAAAWRPALRWPVPLKAAATLALLLAAATWAPPLLAAASGLVALLLLVGKLRRRS